MVLREKSSLGKAALRRSATCKAGSASNVRLYRRIKWKHPLRSMKASKIWGATKDAGWGIIGVGGNEGFEFHC